MHNKKLILIGGGHAHVQVLHAFRGMKVSLTLISDVSIAPYSGMLPGYILGDYDEKDIGFDLKEICSRYGHSFISQAVNSINLEDKIITLEDGINLSFDICSLNVGILPLPIAGENFNNVIYVKPISYFLSKWKNALGALPAIGRVAIIGGGAAAFELAIGCGVRFPGRVLLVSGENGLNLPPGSDYHARNALKNLGIELVEGQRVEKIERGVLHLTSSSLHFTLALIATSACASKFILHSHLPKSSSGHVLIDNYLRVKGSSEVFAVGDCAHFESHDIPKAGVYAVRQGPILIHNLKSALLGSSDLKKFVPQKNILAILISNKKEAIFCWHRFAVRSSWANRLKCWIDKRFMKKFS